MRSITIISAKTLFPSKVLRFWVDVTFWGTLFNPLQKATREGHFLGLVLCHGAKHVGLLE